MNRNVENEDAMRIERLVRRIIEENGYILHEFQMSRSRGMEHVRIFIKKFRHPVTLGDCAFISGLIEEALDAADIIKHRYNLEVSSPGAECPFTTEDDYVENMGNKVKLLLRGMIMGSRELTGRLVSFENGKVGIEVIDRKRTGRKEPVIVTVEYGEIMKGHRVVEIGGKR